MSIAISLPRGITAKVTGLEVWMDRALERLGQLRPDWDADMVHDVRTALRRCRTMADTLREVNPDPGWRKLKKTSKHVFHTLGALRDAQVEQEWIKKLSSRGDPVRKHMLKVLGRRERQFRAAAEDALDQFDRKAWRKLSRKLLEKARFFPLESVVYQREALEALNEAVALYQKARKSPSSVAWHRTRIGIKRFRYIVENFLPQRYEVWAADMKQMQTLLGELHDLDVLRADVKKESSKLAGVDIAQWLEKIDSHRKSRLAEFRLKASSKNAPWPTWRAGFQWGHALIPASLPEPSAARYAS
ncbi:MAG TPA: CHAD domain-containing protein [Candidatus Limnocylindrales bacterium]|nr:CHAD domain-containing protein [Candidatus Limnocylindrales bacterium]